MKISIRNLLGPVAGVMALVIGLALVGAIDALSSVFGTAAQQVSSQTAEAEAAPEPREFSCYDAAILPVWKELRQDEAFKKMTYALSGKHDCSAMLDVKTIDLNNDRRDEYLVRGKSFEVCSVEGCGFWIFENRSGKLVTLLSAVDYENASEIGDQIMRSRNGRYSDILLRTFLTDVTTRFITYRFDGKKYVESRCVYELPKFERNTEGSREFMSCADFDGPDGL